MSLALAILVIAGGWLLVYTGWHGIGVVDELRHIVRPSSPTPSRTN